jgi:hypothetical protein
VHQAEEGEIAYNRRPLRARATKGCWKGKEEAEKVVDRVIYSKLWRSIAVLILQIVDYQEVWEFT